MKNLALVLVSFSMMVACSSSKKATESNHTSETETMMNKTSPEGMEKMMAFRERQEAYKAQMNLTEEQEVLFDDINRRYAKQLMALKDDEGSKFSRFKKMKSINENKAAEMKNILDPEQFKIYLEMQEEMRNRRKNN